MGRLIDADALMKNFCVNSEGRRIPEVDCDNHEITVSIKDIKRIIREQPTAYDVEESQNCSCEYEKAFSNAVKYIEDDYGCCPCNYDAKLWQEKCASCTGECLDDRNKDYDQELSIRCWKDVFLESRGE